MGFLVREDVVFSNSLKFILMHKKLIAIYLVP